MIHLSDLNLDILKRVMHQIYTSTAYFNIINQTMNCLFNEIHNYHMVFSFGTGKIYLESSCSFSFYKGSFVGISKFIV